MAHTLEYNGGMRVKTSVSLPKDLLIRIDRADRNRSAFVEKAARAYLASLERTRRDARDLEILNTNAERLNAEAADVLTYQSPP
jgi:metal-responsive CopG/Arc/MetJ family transcriptional regulator